MGEMSEQGKKILPDLPHPPYLYNFHNHQAITFWSSPVTSSWD